jgi:hypothetical protein
VARHHRDNTVLDEEVSQVRIIMDINNLANMRLSDFEQIGKAEYNKGFRAALETVTNLLDKQVCEDFLADDVCDHDGCSKFSALSQGIITVKNNIQ